MSALAPPPDLNRRPGRSRAAGEADRPLSCLAALAALIALTIAILAACASDGPSDRAGAKKDTEAVSRTAAPTASEAPLSFDPRIVIEAGAHTGIVRRLDVSAARGLVVTAADDRTARIWDLATGQLRQILRPTLGSGDTGRLYGAAIHPTEAVVAIAGSILAPDGRSLILLHSLDDGRLIRRVDARGSDVKRLEWSADGSVLFASYAGRAAGKAPGAADGNDPPALRGFDGEGRLVHETIFSDAAFGLTAARDGRVAASSLDGNITVLTASTGQVARLTSFKAPRERPVGLAFSPDGQRLAIAFLQPHQSPIIVDASSGRTVLALAGPMIEAGTQYTVAWSGDGRTVAATGSGYTRAGRFPIAFHDAGHGRLLGQLDVAGDSILDLRPLGSDGFAWASADGGWGKVDSGVGASDSKSGPKAPRITLNIGPRQADLADLKGARHLLASADGRQLGWMHNWGRQPMRFDLQSRTASAPAARSRSLAAASLSGRWRDSVWEDTLTPRLASRPFTLGPGEIARALATLPGGQGAVFGTSHRLISLDESGAIRWQQRPGAEVRAVTATTDGRMIVTGLSDGTLRWSRSRDGQLLATLLPLGDGRWLIWTPAGYFDASTGADRLAGWTVNRRDEPVADFFSLNRFRQQFNRPDIIDRVLSEALPVAELDPRWLAPPTFPPVVNLAGPARVSTDGRNLQVPVEVRADGRSAVEARIDGRPVEEVSPVSVLAGSHQAVVELPLPAPGSLVQVLARDQNGVSEPMTLAVEAPPPLAAPDAPLGPRNLAPPATTTIQITAPPALAGARPADGSSRRLFILAIGVSEYQRADYNLDLPAKDARDFIALMKRQAGRHYGQVETRTLTDRQATREAVLANLGWLVKTVGRDDIGMLFIAGHGLNSPNHHYFFLPHDGNHEALEQTAVSERAIRDTLAQLRGKALFFIDTCFGGNVVGNFAGASRELARLANDLAAAENGVVVFASSSGRQLSEENLAWGNGAFTLALLAGLDGGADLNRSGRVTFKGLDFFVSEEVSRLTEGRQTPVTIAPIGMPDFAIARVGAI